MHLISFSEGKKVCTEKPLGKMLVNVNRLGGK